MIQLLLIDVSLGDPVLHPKLQSIRRDGNLFQLILDHREILIFIYRENAI